MERDCSYTLMVAQLRRDASARRLPAVAAGLVLLLGQPQGALRAQGSEQSMLVSVLDSSGAPAEGLSPADFVVTEDGAEREVLRVGRSTAPMQLAVLVDTSASAASATSDVRNGLEAFVSQLVEGNEIALVSFGGRPRILVESTRRIERLQDGIGRIFAFSNTAAYLLDALLETARGFERREASRPVIVVVTTEGLDYSGRSATRVLEALQAGRVATHVIVLRDRGSRLRRDQPVGGDDLGYRLSQRDLVLDEGPRTTGGQRRDVPVSSALGDALGRLADILTSQYEVVYARPTSLVPPEDIEVRMRRDDLSAQGLPVRPPG